MLRLSATLAFAASFDILLFDGKYKIYKCRQ
jgi:hypothetical protein